MKVFNLQCGNGHRFEGWFGSDADYESQRERSLVGCPLCGEAQVQRLPSAPRLNLGAVAPAEPAPGPASQAPARSEAQNPGMEALWMQAVRHVLANTEDVGTRFAEEARRIHYGESEQRGIRGRTTRDEARALDEEGIPVLSLPIPDALKGPLQ
ncbi:MAG TPA: DUF1178 family protein [Burkholderiaceae bacterium]|nr:DUF1178 family protein [Burkholderiaceae bacterium]